MKALSIRAPWAGAILLQGKDVENRRWSYPTGHRGPLLIHQARSIDADAVYPPGHPAAGLPVNPILAGGPWLGALVGMATLTAVYDNREGQCQLPWAERGGWCLMLRDPRVFRHPISWRGQLGLFEVPDEAVAEALRQAMTPEQRQQQRREQAVTAAAARGEGMQ
jgi:hypothetical protein